MQPECAGWLAAASGWRIRRQSWLRPPATTRCATEESRITELATRAKIDNSYMCRMLNLTTLAPDIVAAILDETLPPHVTVHELAISPPVLWEEPRSRIGGVGEETQAE